MKYRNPNWKNQTLGALGYEMQHAYKRLLPLTPALSLGERENLSPSLDGLSTARISPPLVCLNEKPDAGDVTETFRIIRDGQLRFPLPKGEGQGEGEGRGLVTNSPEF